MERKPRILKCSCGAYTLEKKCPSCGLETSQPGPSRFSPKDKYGRYRRKVLYG